VGVPLCNQSGVSSVYLSQNYTLNQLTSYLIIFYSYDAVDTALFAIQIKESNYLREYDYVEATYDNVISQFEW